MHEKLCIKSCALREPLEGMSKIATCTGREQPTDSMDSTDWSSNRIDTLWHQKSKALCWWWQDRGAFKAASSWPRGHQPECHYSAENQRVKSEADHSDGFRALNSLLPERSTDTRSNSRPFPADSKKFIWTEGSTWLDCLLLDVWIKLKRNDTSRVSSESSCLDGKSGQLRAVIDTSIKRGLQGHSKLQIHMRLRNFGRHTTGVKRHGSKS